jgi:hypothetical protein
MNKGEVTMENQQFTFTPVQEYEEPVNYVAAIIGALIGGAIAVGLWAASVYFLQYIFYYLLALVGAMVGGGAILLARAHNWKIGILAVLVTIVALVVGDYLQMGFAVGDNSLDIDDYIRYSQFAFENLGETGGQYLMYLIALGMAFYVGTFGNRSGAQVMAGQK